METESKNEIFSEIDENDFSIIMCYLQNNLFYRGFWVGCLQQKWQNAVTDFCCKIPHMTHGPDGTGIEVVESLIKNSDELNQWSENYLDLEQISLVKKHLDAEREIRLFRMD